MRFLFIFIAYLWLPIGLIAQSNISEASKATFEISNFKFKSVKGTFSGMNGNLIFEESDIENAQFDICINSKSINTGNEKRDDHLKNADFFNVEKFPSICYTSTIVSYVNGQFITKGFLTLHGVTKEIAIPFTYNDNVFYGSFTVNRFDYGVGADVNTFMVGSNATIVIQCVIE